MGADDDWREVTSEALRAVSSSVVSSTATGHPDLARTGAKVVVYVTNNIWNISGSVEINQQAIEGYQTTAVEFEKSAESEGVPQTYIFKLKEDRDGALSRATTNAQKVEIWGHYVAGLGKAVNEWAGILKPFGGGSGK